MRPGEVAGAESSSMAVTVLDAAGFVTVDRFEAVWGVAIPVSPEVHTRTAGALAELDDPGGSWLGYLGAGVVAARLANTVRVLPYASYGLNVLLQDDALVRNRLELGVELALHRLWRFGRWGRHGLALRLAVDRAGLSVPTGGDTLESVSANGFSFSLAWRSSAVTEGK